VATRKLAPVPSECWILAEALASFVPAGRMNAIVRASLVTARVSGQFVWRAI
jgi:hypothetical protein